MIGQHQYRLTSTWTGNTGTGTSGYREYSRDITVEVAGKPALLASADKPFRGDPTRWNPEDMLLAALSECHLLSYLYVAVTMGVVVVAYSDDATGVMVEDGKGGGEFTEVVLRPRVLVQSAEMVDAATTAHRKANELCYIARSVRFPVRHEPIIEVAADGAADGAPGASRES